MKLLDKESCSGLLELSNKVLAKLQDKHPAPVFADEESLLNGPTDGVLLSFFDGIDDEQTVLKAAQNTTKGFSGSVLNGS